MILEVVKLRTRQGRAEEFEKAIASAFPLFEAAAGCHGMSVFRSIEEPQVFYCLVRWETVAHHTEKFQKSTDFERLFELIGDLLDGSVEESHCNQVGETGLTASAAGSSWMRFV